jgi:hypothetical protein
MCWDAKEISGSTSFGEEISKSRAGAGLKSAGSGSGMRAYRKNKARAGSGFWVM